MRSVYGPLLLRSAALISAVLLQTGTLTALQGPTSPAVQPRGRLRTIRVTITHPIDDSGGAVDDYLIASLRCWLGHVNAKLTLSESEPSDAVALLDVSAFALSARYGRGSVYSSSSDMGERFTGAHVSGTISVKIANQIVWHRDFKGEREAKGIIGSGAGQSRSEAPFNEALLSGSSGNFVHAAAAMICEFFDPAAMVADPDELNRSSRSFERHFPCKVLKAL